MLRSGRELCHIFPRAAQTLSAYKVLMIRNLFLSTTTDDRQLSDASKIQQRAIEAHLDLSAAATL